MPIYHQCSYCTTKWAIHQTVRSASFCTVTVADNFNLSYFMALLRPSVKHTPCWCWQLSGQNQYSFVNTHIHTTSRIMKSFVQYKTFLFSAVRSDLKWLMEIISERYHCISSGWRDFRSTLRFRSSGTTTGQNFQSWMPVKSCQFLWINPGFVCTVAWQFLFSFVWTSQPYANLLLNAFLLLLLHW